ncbi:MAG: DUF6273 domain-containing protein [Oscillospiraceae bacterium]|jgi:predicted small lipoprotein YifL|nr:DUF6273 domain-containing protein [Oscillospiraceae bacterium]
MKKLLLFLLAAVMVFSLAACGEDSNAGGSSTPPTNSTPETSSTTTPGGTDSTNTSTTAPNANAQGDAVALIKSGQTRGILFGGYEWRVLTVEGGKAFLLAEDGVANHEFQDGVKYKVKDETTHYIWAYSTLRAYLNGDFLNAFTPEEQAQIAVTQVVTPNNPQFDTAGGPDTEDKIFALSVDEVEKYLPTAADKKARGYLSGVKTRAWWLRTPGATSMSAVAVTDVIGMNGGNDVQGGVRPALWLNLQ